mgnify:CR=1 FL=1
MEKVILFLGSWILLLATVWIGFVIYLRLRWLKEKSKQFSGMRMLLPEDREGETAEKEALIEKMLKEYNKRKV